MQLDRRGGLGCGRLWHRDFRLDHLGRGLFGRLLYGLIGVTWAFHFTFTCWMIPKKQTDLTDHGTFFSLVVIYLMNLGLLSVMLVLASSQITFADLGGEFVNNSEKFARWVSER